MATNKTVNNDENLTLEQIERLHHQRVGALFTVFATIIGFFFWPVMVDFLSDSSLIDMMMHKPGWFTSLWLAIMSFTAVFSGIIALVYSKDC